MYKMKKLTMGAVCTLVALAVVLASGTANAATQHAGPETVSFALTGSQFGLMDIRYDQVFEELEGNRHFRVERIEEPAGQDVRPMGVSFGWRIYVTLSKSQAKAINTGSAAAATAILGLATGGIGAIIAAAVYGYVQSIGNDNIDRCRGDVELAIDYVGNRVGWKCL